MFKLDALGITKCPACGAPGRLAVGHGRNLHGGVDAIGQGAGDPGPVAPDLGVAAAARVALVA